MGLYIVDLCALTVVYLVDLAKSHSSALQDGLCNVYLYF